MTSLSLHSSLFFQILTSTPVLDSFKIQPVKMINLLLQNNIILSVLCWFDAYGKISDVLMVECADNQFINLHTRQITGSLIHLTMKI
jgi:Mg2+/citrate symporter